MAKLSILAGATSQTINIFIQDSSSTTGQGLAGLVFNTSGLVAYYALPKAASVQITLATLAAVTTAYSSGGFKEIDATNMKGWYRLDLPDAAIASGRFVSVHLSGATNMAPCPVEIELTAWNNQDAVRGGMTALPNANAAAANGLPVLGTNATLISFTAGMVISNAGGDALQLTSSGSNGNGLAAAGNGSGAGLKSTAGATGNGLQLIGGATSGSGMKVSGTAGNAIALELVGQGSAAALSSTGGATGAAAKFVGGATSGDGIDITTTSGDGLSITPTAGNGIVATANGTSKHGIVSTGGTAGTSDGVKAVAGTGGVPIRGDITGNVTGNLSGSVGSVTGVVGSVTGAVGSVTGAVGSVTGNVGGNVVGSVASVTAGVTLAAAAVQAIWDALTSALTTTGSIGKLLAALPGSLWDVVLSGHLTSGTTGAALNAAGAAGDPWSTSIPGAYGAGTAGFIVGTNVDALISSRTKPADTQAAVTTATNLTNAPTAGDFTATMKTSLNSSTPGISAAGIQAIWDALTSALTTVGSIGKRLADFITGDAFVRLGAPVGASISADIAGVQSDTDNIQTRLPAALVSGRMDSSEGAIQVGVDFSAAMKTSLNAATPASVTGAVGSVTGAVGSVTGNVGGNVVGSVGSLTTNNDKTGYSLTAGQLFLKKNTGFTLTFLMTDSTTHAPATGLTVSSQRSIDGAALANTTNSVVEISGGLYKLSISAADVNGTQITFLMTATGADTKAFAVVTQA